MSPALALPGWIEEQRQRLTVLSSELVLHSALENFEEKCRTSRESISASWAQTDSGLHAIYESLNECPDALDVRKQFWTVLCQALRNAIDGQALAHRALAAGGVVRRSAVGLAYFRDLDRLCAVANDRYVELIRLVLVENPEWELEVPADLESIVWTVRISPLAYLRAMWNLFWSAIRHPFLDTTIDLSTGRVLYRT